MNLLLHGCITKRKAKVREGEEKFMKVSCATVGYQADSTGPVREFALFKRLKYAIGYEKRLFTAGT